MKVVETRYNKGRSRRRI